MKSDRPEEHELLFPWKAARGERRRLGLAVLMAVGLCALAGALLEVRGRVEDPTPRKTASFVLLSPKNEGAREVLEWARRQSPFQEPWDIRVDDVIASEIAVMEDRLRKEHRYQPSLWPSPSPIPEPELPKLFNVDLPELPPVKRIGSEFPIVPAGPLLVVTRATGSLLERWQDPTEPLPKLFPDAGANEEELAKLLGEQRSYQIGIDAEGSIIFCQMSGGEESLMNEAAGVWLRRQQAKPEEGANLVFGTVEVQVVRAPKEE